ncbi:hypothetical protein CCYA_CCYA07G2113 [Cyanidiococcus yangmingshanensis]|nr:hypothetical protein CCYA_CCYA07G2113 [Cyanidiococcus yangmingshanensis]
MGPADSCSGDDTELLESVLGPVQRTCYDAWLSKCLAARYGYFDDPYIAQLNPLNGALKGTETSWSCSRRRSGHHAGSNTGAWASTTSRTFCGTRQVQGSHLPDKHEDTQRAPSLARDYQVDPVLLHGTYARVVALRRIVVSVLDMFWQMPHERSKALAVQVLSIGAGMDSLPFWLLAKETKTWTQTLDAGRTSDRKQEQLQRRQLRYDELDMEEVAMLKAACIQRHEALARAIQAPGHHEIRASSSRGSSPDSLCAENMANEGVSCVSPHQVTREARVLVETPVYGLTAVDLGRGRDAINAALKHTRRHRCVSGGPRCTLILLECILAYLSPNDTAELFEVLREHFCDHPAVVVCYDPIDLSDQFGRHMRARLEERGAPLLGLNCTVNLKQAIRNLELLFVPDAAPHSHGRGLDMMQVYKRLLEDPSERSRLDRILVLDENEELALLMHHYGLIWVGNTHVGPLNLLGDTQ